MKNYITDGGNPFDLAGPPTWWLKKLFDFDPDLVVIPSRMGFFYRLAQRRPLDPRVQIVNSISNDSDSTVLARLGLVPVTTILATARWDNPLMWEDLRQRSPHRMGGAEKFEAALIEKEKRKELEIAKQNDDMLNYLGKDAWKYYLLKSGRRTSMWSPATKEVAEKPTFGKSAGFKILDANGKVISRR